MNDEITVVVRVGSAVPRVRGVPSATGRTDTTVQPTIHTNK